jgi:hypothetical protein
MRFCNDDISDIITTGNFLLRWAITAQRTTKVVQLHDEPHVFFFFHFLLSILLCLVKNYFTMSCLKSLLCNFKSHVKFHDRHQICRAAENT